jgi:quercetin dioxygenase-like cupin family protein
MSEMIPVGPLGIRFLVEAEDSGGTAAIFEVHIPAGGKPPVPHSHDGYEETVYGLRGVSTWTVGGVPHAIGPGDAFCIRRGLVHGFVNEGAEPAVALCVVTPGVLGPGFFREIGAVIGHGAPDPAAVGEVMRRHGLTPAPPA